MGVLGAQFIGPDFSAGAKIEVGRQTRDAPFQKSLANADKWLALNRKGKGDEAKLQADIERVKSQTKLNQSATAKNIIAVESEKMKQITQVGMDASALLTLNESRAMTEKYTKDPNSVSREEMTAMKFKLDSLKGTNHARDAATSSGFWTVSLDSSTDKVFSDNQDKAIKLRAEGNFYSSKDELKVDNPDDIYAVSSLDLGGGNVGHTINFDKITPQTRISANGIINRLISSDKDFDSLSDKDERTLSAAGAADEGIQEKIDKLAEDKAKVREDIAKEKRGVGIAAEKARGSAEITSEFEEAAIPREVQKAADITRARTEAEAQARAAQPAKVTVREGPDAFGVRQRTITATGSAEAIAAAEADEVFGAEEADFDFGIEIAERPAGLTDEQFVQTEENFKEKLKEIDEDIALATVEISGTGEFFGGIEDSTARKAARQTEREQLIQQAADNGVDLTGAVSQDVTPAADVSAASTRGTEGVQSILSALDSLN